MSLQLKRVVGASPVSGSHDQLVISDKQVVWYEGLDPSIQTVRKVYSTDTAILQAFWCNFSLEEDNKRRGPGGGAKRCGGVCIREQESLGIYMESGVVHYVPFPFQASTSSDVHAHVHDYMTSGERGVASGRRCVSGETGRS